MNRYSTAPLTAGLALFFVFSSFQADHAHGFQVGQSWNTASADFGKPVDLTWSLVPDGTFLPADFIAAPVTTNEPSSMIAALDNTFHPFGSVPPGTLEQRGWFNLFESSFERWDSLSGVSYQYEPNDDGATVPFNFGAPGVRGDMRIGSHPIDGPGGVLAFNSAPTFSDMVIDKDILQNNQFAGNSQQLRNVLMHEIGHGLGVQHVITLPGGSSFSSNTFLMERFTNTAFDGPQLDDILAVQRLYGDVNEKGLGNNTFATATSLGDLLPGAPIAIGTNGDTTAVAFTDVDFVSINGTSDENGNLTTTPAPDVDVYSFTITSSSFVDVQLTPKGPTYQEGPVGGTLETFDASAQNDLSLQLLGSNGTTLLAGSNFNGLGENEAIFNIQLNPGEYFVRVQGGLLEAVQLYQLDITASAIPEPTSVALLVAAALCLPGRRRSRG